MRKMIDVAGQRFGRWTAIALVGTQYGHALWHCRCDCGEESTVSGGELRKGHTQSCGCLQREVMSARHRTHGGKGSRLYGIWSSMHQRCKNSHVKAWPHYGGRGIKVCDEWRHDFAAFRDWAVSHGYQEGLSIDRIDNDGNYCPDNCQWLTRAENAAKSYRDRGLARAS